MIKNEKYVRKTRPTGAHHHIFLLGVILLFTLFSMNFISADLDFDNVKEYDSETNTITIVDNFGLGSDLARIRLLTPQINLVMPGEDRKVAELYFETYEEFLDVFNEMELFDIKHNMKSIQREIKYKQKQIRLDDGMNYITECDTYANGSDYCYSIWDGDKDYKVEVVEWIPLNSEQVDFQPGENITIGIYTDVMQGDYVEWIPTFFNIKMEEWAAWSDSLSIGLKHYWSFDSETGSVVEDDRGHTRPDLNQYNGTWIGNLEYRSGIHNDGAYFDGSSGINITGGFADLPNQSQNFTVSMWINITQGDPGAPSTYWIMDNLDTTSDQWTLSYAPSASRLWFYGGDSGNYAYCDDSYFDGTGAGSSWAHIVLMRNHTGKNNHIYLNGVPCFDAIGQGSITSSPINFGFRQRPGSAPDRYIPEVMLDEIGIWNRSLSDSEISNLYDGGTGTFYTAVGISTFNVSLWEPPSDYGTTLSYSSFRANFSSVGISNLINSTLYLMYTNGTPYETNTTLITGTYNESNLSISNIPVGSFLWNYVACGTNLTGGVDCETAPSNFTFARNLFSEIAWGYNGNTTEGSTETFRLNVTFEIGSQISETNLYYNNTLYSGFYTNWGSNNYELYKTIVVDAVNAEQILNFYWELILDDGSIQNSTLKGQNVKLLSIDDCSANTNRIYNFTIVDERTQSKLNPTNFNTTGKINANLYSLDRSLLLESYNATNNQINSFAMCLSSNLTNNERYSIDVQVNYFADEYAREFYHISNNTLEQESLHTNISLYLLENSSAQEFKIIYKGANLLPVEGALIQVQRNYVDENVFKTVEIPKTDANGETRASLELDNVIYTFVVTKDGKLLDIFSNIGAECQNPTFTTCTINLKSSLAQISTKDFRVLEDFTYALSFNETSRTVTAIYAVPSGTLATVLLNATLADSLGTTQVCSHSLYASSGILVCTIPTTFGNGSAYVSLYKNGELLSKGALSLAQDNKEVYGGALIFLSMFLFLTLLGMGIGDNPMITGIFMILGAIISIALNLTNTGLSSYVGYGATVLWLIIAIVIILIKSGNRS